MKLEGKFDRPGRNDSLLAQSGVGGKGGKWRHSLFIGLLSLCVTYSSHPQGWVPWKTIFPCGGGRWCGYVCAGVGGGFRMIQPHYTYCALYFYYQYIVMDDEIVIQLTTAQNQWEPWAGFPELRCLCELWGAVVNSEEVQLVHLPFTSCWVSWSVACGLWTPDLQDNPGVSVTSKASQNSHFKNMAYLT